MSLTQQYALDLYRAAQRGEPAPPAPGRHDWAALRELRDYGDFRAVIKERPARRRGVPRAVRGWVARARARSAAPGRDVPDTREEGAGRGGDIVGRPVQCG